MDRTRSAPSPIVIGQDDQTEIHVQAPAQSGRRHLDVRIWRRGPVGFAPSGIGITLHAGDLDALREAIGELLEASNGGDQVARVVYDVDGGRRVRAETEPFGTRYVARLGFWQRVRDTWRPADEGLVVAADRLRALQAALDRFRLWIHSTVVDNAIEPEGGVVPHREELLHWPNPGADWLTMEPDRVAFHPRGCRITCSVVEQEARHWLSVRQWRREETLWLPEQPSLTFTVLDLDLVIPALRQLVDARRTEEALLAEAIQCQDGSTVRLEVLPGEPEMLVFSLQLPERDDRVFGFEPVISLPAEHMARFGRALAQGWSMLLGWLSDEERAEMETRQFRERAEAETGTGTPEAAPALTEPAPETAAEPSETSLAPTEELTLVAPAAPEETRPNLPLGWVFHFGAESETPGTVIPYERSVRVVVEGFAQPRVIELPLDVVPRVASGLEDLNRLRQRQMRVDPVLLCDRPDCAVYGRAGTLVRPEAVEVRVWTGPTTSEAVSFEGVYLDDLLRGLRRSLELAGEPGMTRSEPEPTAQPPAPRVQPGAPTRLRRIAPSQPLAVPGPMRLDGDGGAAVEPLSVDLEAVQLGRHRVRLKLRGYRHYPSLALEWEGQYFELPMEQLEELLADLRELYYDALRGRRGRTLSVGEYPVVTIGVRNQGAQLYIAIQQEIDGELTELSFPANEMPVLLDATRTALQRV